jgi:hypothetical protein
MVKAVYILITKIKADYFNQTSSVPPVIADEASRKFSYLNQQALKKY